MRRRLPRTVKKTLISVLVMILLFVLAATVYVYVTGNEAPPPKKSKAQSEAVQALPKPPPPATNASEGVAMQTLTAPAAPGENSMASVSTIPTSICNISVTYGGAAVTDSGLAAQTADAYGTASWTWTVPASAPVGSWPVKVTCVYRGRTGLVIQNQDITKS